MVIKQNRQPIKITSITIKSQDKSTNEIHSFEIEGTTSGFSNLDKDNLSIKEVSGSVVAVFSRSEREGFVTFFKKGSSILAHTSTGEKTETVRLAARSSEGITGNNLKLKCFFEEESRRRAGSSYSPWETDENISCEVDG